MAAAAVGGLCWGVGCSAMAAHVSLPNQLLVRSVATLAAASYAADGFAFTTPSQAFLLTTLCPIIAGLLVGGGRLHHILALKLLLFVPMTLWQGRHKPVSVKTCTRHC